MKHTTLFLVFLSILTLNTKSQQGTLDPTFGNKGIVMQSFSTYSSLTKQAIQNDDKIVVLAYSNTFGNILLRYLPDGNIDSAFGENGIVKTYNYYSLSGIAIQKDGKIVTTGTAANAFPSNVVLLRFLADGRTDSSFGANGIVISTFGSYGQGANDIAIQQDEKIVITGTYQRNAQFEIDAFVARYNSDGSLDVTFGDGGTAFVYNIWMPTTIALQKDGKILIGGSDEFVGDFHQHFFLARFNLDGELDSSFNKTGIVITAFDNDGAFIQEIALQPDGKIVAAGSAGQPGWNGVIPYIAVARYNTDGVLDQSFGKAGKTGIKFTEYSQANAVALQQNGKIVVAGFESYTDGNYVVARFLESGVLDSAFGTNGVTVTDIGTLSDQAKDVVIQKNGRIIVGGSPDITLAGYIGDPVHQSLITRIKRWIIKHILHFQDLNADNTAYYVIEKSHNSTTNFKEVARVEQSAISSQSPVDNQQSETYSYVLPASDNRQSTSDNFYRIKAVHNDGSVTYSDVIADNGLTDTPINGLTISPNPVKNVLHIQGLSAENKTSLFIINPEGNVIKKTSVQANSYDFNVSNLKQGTYYLKAENNEGSKTFQFIKE